MRILCYGDSNTWGYNPETAQRFPESIRWTKCLELLLNEKSEVIEEGLRCRTISFDDPIHLDCNGTKTLNLILKTHQPFDLLIIMLGTNDLKNIFHCDAESIAKGIRNMIQIAKNPFLWEETTCPKILVVSPPKLNKSIFLNPNMYFLFDELALEKSSRLALLIKKVCDQYQVSFLDTSKTVMGSDFDGVHLDKESHLILADLIAKKVISLNVSKNNFSK